MKMTQMQANTIMDTVADNICMALTYTHTIPFEENNAEFYSTLVTKLGRSVFMKICETLNYDTVTDEEK